MLLKRRRGTCFRYGRIAVWRLADLPLVASSFLSCLISKFDNALNGHRTSTSSVSVGFKAMKTLSR